jgi:hypothetical protein
VQKARQQASSIQFLSNSQSNPAFAGDLMFIDYLTLMIINLAAGLALLAAYVYFGLVGQIRDAGFQALV